MDDVISRQDVIGVIDTAETIYVNNLPPMIYVHTLKKAIMTIPTQPQRTGRWILDENDFLTKCSECGCHPWFGVIPTTKEATKKLPHCPMCLAKMEGE